MAWPIPLRVSASRLAISPVHDLNDCQCFGLDCSDSRGDGLGTQTSELESEVGDEEGMCALCSVVVFEKAHLAYCPL